jgi:hypothetical protein
VARSLSDGANNYGMELQMLDAITPAATELDQDNGDEPPNQ